MRESNKKLLLMSRQRFLLIDPIYNPGTVPPNISLGRLETALSTKDNCVSVVDFVSPDCEHNDLSYFKQQELLFLNNILTQAQFADLIYITTGHGNELKPYPIWPRIHYIASEIKRQFPTKKIIVGGALVNLYKKVYKIPDDILKDRVIDLIIEGHENNLLSVVGAKSTNSQVKPLLWTSWDKKKYPDFRSLMYHVGCQYCCDFCFEGKIFNKDANIEKAEMLFSSINYAKSKEGINKFVLEDSTVMSYPDIEYLISGISEQNIEFSIYARISEILKKPETVEKLRRAGCKSFIIGIETLNDDLLKQHHKGLVSSQTRNALDILKHNDIQVQGCFMLGFPDDTLDNMYKTVEFAVNENLNGYRWHIYQPNFTQIDKRFFSQTKITAFDHLKVQLNVPDHLLSDMLDINPEISIMDEHFLLRARDALKTSKEQLKHLGYAERFNYNDLLAVVNSLPKNIILNEERLYQDLFKQKQR